MSHVCHGQQRVQHVQRMDGMDGMNSIKIIYIYNYIINALICINGMDEMRLDGCAIVRMFTHTHTHAYIKMQHAHAQIHNHIFMRVCRMHINTCMDAFISLCDFEFVSVCAYCV